jgi:hypothetical protein
MQRLFQHRVRSIISSLGGEVKVEGMLQHNSDSRCVKVKRRQICDAEADLLFSPCESHDGDSCVTNAAYYAVSIV